jgi:hypothetical protein
MPLCRHGGTPGLDGFTHVGRGPRAVEARSFLSSPRASTRKLRRKAAILSSSESTPRCTVSMGSDTRCRRRRPRCTSPRTEPSTSTLRELDRVSREDVAPLVMVFTASDICVGVQSVCVRRRVGAEARGVPEW